MEDSRENSSAKDGGVFVGLNPRAIGRGFAFPTFPLTKTVDIGNFKHERKT